MVCCLFVHFCPNPIAGAYRGAGSGSLNKPWLDQIYFSSTPHEHVCAGICPPVIVPEIKWHDNSVFRCFFCSPLAHERTLSEVESEAVGVNAVCEQRETWSQAKTRMIHSLPCVTLLWETLHSHLKCTRTFMSFDSFTSFMQYLHCGRLGLKRRPPPAYTKNTCATAVVLIVGSNVSTLLAGRTLLFMVLWACA